MPTLININVTEDVVKSIGQNKIVEFRQGGTDSEAIKGWLLKFWGRPKKLGTRCEMFIDWLTESQSPVGGLLFFYVWTADHAK